MDATGDLAATGSLLDGKDALDLDRAWVSATREDPDDYSVNVQVESLAEVPPNSIYYVEFSDDAGRHRPWMAAHHTATGEWLFTSGERLADIFFVGAVYQSESVVRGSIDVGTSTVSMVIPRSIITADDIADERPFGPFLVSSNLSLGSPVPAESFLGPHPAGAKSFVDSFVNGEACEVLLQQPDQGTNG